MKFHRTRGVRFHLRWDRLLTVAGTSLLLFLQPFSAYIFRFLVYAHVRRCYRGRSLILYTDASRHFYNVPMAILYSHSIIMCVHKAITCISYCIMKINDKYNVNNIDGSSYCTVRDFVTENGSQRASPKNGFGDPAAAWHPAVYYVAANIDLSKKL